MKALQAFEAASRCGSFAQGANELHVTPSAVSHQIQLLEAFLGAKLFRRHAGRALLTDVGAVYAREIDRVFGCISDATDLVSPQPRSGHLVIAASPSFASKWLQPRLPDFLRANPKLKVRLTTISETDDPELASFDVAIVFRRRDLPAGSQPTSLLLERFRPMCSPALATALCLRSPADLARATLIHSKNALTWTDYFQRVGHGEVRARLRRQCTFMATA